MPPLPSSLVASEPRVLGLVDLDWRSRRGQLGSCARLIPLQLSARNIYPLRHRRSSSASHPDNRGGAFLRGWVLQWAGRRIGNIVVLSVIGGVAFSLPHLLNPEVAGDFLGAFLGYFSVGFALAWVTVRDRSLEIAIAAHLSNNLFAALVVGYEGGALPADALFVAGPIEWGTNNIVGLLFVPLFILFTRAGRPKASNVGSI